MLITLAAGLVVLLIVGCFLRAFEVACKLEVSVLDILSLASFLVLIVAGCFVVGFVVRKVIGF